VEQPAKQQNRQQQQQQQRHVMPQHAAMHMHMHPHQGLEVQEQSMQAAVYGKRAFSGMLLSLAQLLCYAIHR
jgi:hypothetical protein